MSKLNIINNNSTNESPYKLFSPGKERENEIKTLSKSTLNPYNHTKKNKKKKYSLFLRPLTSTTRDDREVSLIGKKLKSMTLSNESYSNYINYYSNLTQDYAFKSPKITSYPLRKNEKYLPITFQVYSGNPNNSSTRRSQDSVFLDFIKETEQNSKKKIESKPYGFKYGETKIRIDRKRAKSAFPTINPKDFQNLCETNIFESELLNQIGLKKIDMYNNLEEVNKNFKFFNIYLEKLSNIDDLFNYDNSYKIIKFNARTSISKKTIFFKLEIFSLCFKFYSLGKKSTPQKLYFPFKLLPLFYLLDFQLFKVFLSEIIYYDDKNDCMAFIKNNLLLNQIKKYYNFISNTIKNDSKYINFITYYKNELLFYLIYDWIISNITKDNEKYKCLKLKITLPKIKFYIDNYNIKINKHLNKHILANIIINDFLNWERFILFDLFSNKRFKNITNLIMLNKENIIQKNKIYLNRNPNKELIGNKKFEFYLSEKGENFSYFFIFVPNIILVLYGEKKKRYQKINLSWNESKNINKFKQHWGTINTLLKCMYIDSNTKEIFFKLDLLDNINKDLYKVIAQENCNSKINSISHNIRRNSSQNNIGHIKEKDKDKDKNKTKYKSNNLEITLLECSFKKINISDINLETKYYKVPEIFLKTIFSINEEKGLFNTNFNDISIIGKCIGECSYNIINPTEENIINEEQNMKKKAKDTKDNNKDSLLYNKSINKSPERNQMEKSQYLKSNIKNNNNNKFFQNYNNKNKSFKISSNGNIQNNFIKKSKTNSDKLDTKASEKLDDKAFFKFKFNDEYFENDNSVFRNKRAVTIKNINDLKKDRIKFEYPVKDYKKHITNKI